VAGSFRSVSSKRFWLAAALALAAAGARVLLPPGTNPRIELNLPIIDVWNGTVSAAEALDVRVLPGITAMLAAAARAGAPLGHDFCTINLSDNLKPWALIEKRLRAALGADMAMAFYNPRSASRPHTFEQVLRLLRETCEPERLLLFARAISTPQERLRCVPLADATPGMADMRTLVIVGSSTTRRVGRFVYTPRSVAA